MNFFINALVGSVIVAVAVLVSYFLPWENNVNLVVGAGIGGALCSIFSKRIANLFVE
jgi:hypothetical protein